MHAILIVVVALCLSPLTGTPVNAQTNDSDAIFVEAVAAVKNKDYGHAVKLFSSQAEANQHDAQYNLAVLLKAGKGAPQDFLKALTWAWAAHLGGIEAAEDLSDELLDLIPKKSIEAAREAVAKRLRARIDDGEKPAVMQFQDLPTVTTILDSNFDNFSEAFHSYLPKEAPKTTPVTVRLSEE